MVMTKDIICPNCNKGYGTNTRKDGSIRCRLCGYEGLAMTQEKNTIPAENSPVKAE
jgi:DNA-directed RNA polymerase subunit RPC12/RpoP